MYTHIFEDEPDFDHFSEETLRLVEQKLGVTLPEDYVALMKVLVKLKGTSYKQWPFLLLAELIDVLAQCDDDVALAYVPKLQAEVAQYKK